MAGRVRPITLVGTPVLHRPCRPVEDFDDGLKELVDDMFASMYEADGVGLAANQIGVDLRVFVYDCPDEDGERRKGVVVNPVLELPTLENRRLDDGEEVSVRGPTPAWPARARPLRVDGEPITVEDGPPRPRLQRRTTSRQALHRPPLRVPAKKVWEYEGPRGSAESGGSASGYRLTRRSPRRGDEAFVS